MVEIFSTDIQGRKEAAVVKKKLKDVMPNAKINFDLQDKDNILRIEDEQISCREIKKVLHTAGWQCEALL